MMQLRSYSSALVGVLLWSTSPHAEGSPFDPALFVDCREGTYVAQLLDSDIPQAAGQIEQAAADSTTSAGEPSPIAETAGQLDLEIPHWLVLLDHEGESFTFVSLAFDGSWQPDTTGAICAPGLALDGFEDR